MQRSVTLSFNYYGCDLPVLTNAPCQSNAGNHKGTMGHDPDSLTKS